jgi:hypothetical protein
MIRYAPTDVIPDIFKIEDGIRTQNVCVQARNRRRCSDLRRNRVRASAGSTASPRSSEATAAEFLVELSQPGGASLIVLCQKSKGFPNYLTGGVLAPGFDFGADELFGVGRKRDVHCGVPDRHFTCA